MQNLTIPLEDELGDVLEKAMRRAALSEATLAERAGVAPVKILDAIDYRPDFTPAELRRLAAALGLNEIGFCALGCGQYPLPEAAALPFCVYPLHMTHGVGYANAYVVADCSSSHGLLFDTGPGTEALEGEWPAAIKTVDAVFLTHAEAEHTGGLGGVLARFGAPAVFGPAGLPVAAGRAMGEGERRTFGRFAVTALSTPGHASAHNCYVVTAPAARPGGTLLISGDLIFAGSVGGGYFCQRQLATHLRRVLAAVPPPTVIAPGHGPLTSAENELRYNPFVV